MPFAATWMDPEIITLSEVSQKRQTNIIWYHLYVESKKKKTKHTNLFTKQKETHRHSKQTYGYQRGKRWGRDKLGGWDQHIPTITYIYKTETDSQTENRLVVVKGKQGMNWEFGISRCKLLHLEWINNKAILYSIGNYIQSLQIRKKRNKGK